MRKQGKAGEGMGSEAARRLGAGVRALSRLRRSLAGQNRHATQATLFRNFAGKEAGGSYPAKIDLSTPPPAPPPKRQKQNKTNSEYKHPVEFQKLNIKLKKIVSALRMMEGERKGFYFSSDE